MKPYRHHFIICCLCLFVFSFLPHALSQKKKDTLTKTTHTLTGLLHIPGNRLAHDVIVIIQPLEGQELPEPEAMVMNIKEKKLEPSLAVVNTHQQLFICNPSSTTHNIYSPSSHYPFDMGFLQKNDTNGKALPFLNRKFKPGRFDIYCSMYEGVYGTVLLIPSKQRGCRVNKDGSFSIEGLAPGAYVIHTWQRDTRFDNVSNVRIEIPHKNRLQLNLYQRNKVIDLKALK